MRTLVLGDVHGEHKQLKQVLLAANVSDEDLIISLGDVVDRGPEPFKCMQILHDLKHVILIKGNHDVALRPYTKGYKHALDGHHGSYITMGKWRTADEPMQSFVRRFLAEQESFYIDRHNNCYVHAGFDYTLPITEQHEFTLLWDRKMWEDAMAYQAEGLRMPTVEGFKKVFIGHTPTISYGSKDPMFCAGVWNIDTGCGKGGLLTIMDVETEQYWQA